MILAYRRITLVRMRPNPGRSHVRGLFPITLYSSTEEETLQPPGLSFGSLSNRVCAFSIVGPYILINRSFRKERNLYHAVTSQINENPT